MTYWTLLVEDYNTVVIVKSQAFLKCSGHWVIAALDNYLMPTTPRIFFSQYADKEKLDTETNLVVSTRRQKRAKKDTFRRSQTSLFSFSI